MEEAIEELVDQPTGNACAADGGHFFGRIRRCVFVDGRGEPRRYGAPFSSDVEGQVVDGAVEPGEAIDVFIVVEGGTGHSEPLVGEGILQLLNLALLFKVVFLDFAILIFCLIIRLHSGHDLD